MGQTAAKKKKEDINLPYESPEDRKRNQLMDDHRKATIGRGERKIYNPLTSERFESTMQEKKKKPPEDDMVTRIQKYAKSESDKKAAEEEKKRKTKGKVDTAPSKGILSRIYEFATGIKEPEKKK